MAKNYGKTEEEMSKNEYIKEYILQGKEKGNKKGKTNANL